MHRAIATTVLMIAAYFLNKQSCVANNVLEIRDIADVHYRSELVIETQLYQPEAWIGLKLQVELQKKGEGKAAAAKEITELTPQKLSIVFDVSRLQPGPYTVTVKLLKDDKLIDSASSTTEIRKFPEAGRNCRTTIDKENTLIVNGKPFFPIMCWCNSSDNFKEIKELGFNTVAGQALPSHDSFLIEHSKDYMDAARKYGLKVMSSAVRYNWGSPPKLTCPDPAEAIRELKGHPALLGWFTGDEVFANKVSVRQMDELYKMIKENDPEHPVYLDLFNAEVIYFKEVTGVSDIVSFNFYPIPDKPVTSYRHLLQTLRRRIADRKPALVWLQLELGKERSRNPTPQELRCITYLVIVHGAKGIGYFIYSKNVSDENKNALKKIFSELKELEHVILAPASDFAIEFKADSAEDEIDMVIKEYNGEKYLFAVNVRNTPVKARLKTGAITPQNQELNVMFENRKVKVKDNSFTDNFAGYDVHIYKIN